METFSVQSEWKQHHITHHSVVSPVKIDPPPNPTPVHLPKFIQRTAAPLNSMPNQVGTAKTSFGEQSSN